jgi:hypothetical protein
MDWKDTDKRLIRRGELILDPSLLKNHKKELKTRNTHRIGRPYTMSHSYVKLLAVIRYLYSLPYRQLEGFTRALNRLVLDLPTGDYSGLRRRILAQPVDPYADLKDTTEPVTIAVDSHRHKHPQGRRLGGAEARKEEEVHQAPLRRKHGGSMKWLRWRSPWTMPTT